VALKTNAPLSCREREGETESAANLSDKILETIPRQFGIAVDVRLGQVSPQNVHAHLEVRLVEIVRHVPADLAVLAPLLDHRVEERQHKDERWEGRMRALGQRRRVDLEIRTSHVQLESVWWLGNNLSRVNHRVKYIFYLESIRPIRTAENFEAVEWATGFSNKHGCIVGL